ENNEEFPDDASFARWGGGMKKDDWRRQNVDQLIEQTFRAIKQEKPGVQFGVSPFGIWRPRNPRHVRGLDAYAQIYADSRKWLQQGWVDYLTPQLYWATTAPQQSFPQLLCWWLHQNTVDKHVWPGLAITRVGGKFTSDEIVKQINYIRHRNDDPGWILFTAGVLL